MLQVDECCGEAPCHGLIVVLMDDHRESRERGLAPPRVKEYTSVVGVTYGSSQSSVVDDKTSRTKGTNGDSSSHVLLCHTADLKSRYDRDIKSRKHISDKKVTSLWV